MWTATVKSKELVGGALNVTVDFTDGTRTVTESCVPSDKAGFEFWVKSRLATFNAGEDINTVFQVGAPIVITEPTPVLPTAEEVARNEWFNDYRKLQQIQKLIELSVLTGNETQVVNLRNKVKNNFLPAYIDAL